jgi:hypothetical protein
MASRRPLSNTVADGLNFAVEPLSGGHSGLGGALVQALNFVLSGSARATPVMNDLQGKMKAAPTDVQTAMSALRASQAAKGMQLGGAGGGFAPIQPFTFGSATGAAQQLQFTEEMIDAQVAAKYGGLTDTQKIELRKKGRVQWLPQLHQMVRAIRLPAILNIFEQLQFEPSLIGLFQGLFLIADLAVQPLKSGFQFNQSNPRAAELNEAAKQRALDGGSQVVSSIIQKVLQVCQSHLRSTTLLSKAKLSANDYKEFVAAILGPMKADKSGRDPTNALVKVTGPDSIDTVLGGWSTLQQTTRGPALEDLAVALCVYYLAVVFYFSKQPGDTKSRTIPYAGGFGGDIQIVSQDAYSQAMEVFMNVIPDTRAGVWAAVFGKVYGDFMSYQEPTGVFDPNQRKKLQEQAAYYQNPFLVGYMPPTEEMAPESYLSVFQVVHPCQVVMIVKNTQTATVQPLDVEHVTMAALKDGVPDADVIAKNEIVPIVLIYKLTDGSGGQATYQLVSAAQTALQRQLAESYGKRESAQVVFARLVDIYPLLEASATASQHAPPESTKMDVSSGMVDPSQGVVGTGGATSAGLTVDVLDKYLAIMSDYMSAVASGDPTKIATTAKRVKNEILDTNGTKLFQIVQPEVVRNVHRYLTTLRDNMVNGKVGS